MNVTPFSFSSLRRPKRSPFIISLPLGCSLDFFILFSLEIYMFYGIYIDIAKMATKKRLDGEMFG